MSSAANEPKGGLRVDPVAASAALPDGNATPASALSSSPESVGVTGVSIGARLRELRDHAARWDDQGESYVAMKRHPQREWFNGNGEALQQCARQLNTALDLLEAALGVGEPLRKVTAIDGPELSARLRDGAAVIRGRAMALDATDLLLEAAKAIDGLTFLAQQVGVGEPPQPTKEEE